MRRYILIPVFAMVAVVAWVQAGADRYSALRRQGDALLGVLRSSAEETAQTLQAAERHLAERLLAVARRADTLIEHTRRPAAEVLQEVADVDQVGRLFLVDAKGQPIARAQFPRPVNMAPGLIDASVHVDLDWERTLQSVQDVKGTTGAIEGLKANVFGTRDRFGVMLKREDGGTIVVRENADRLGALRRRFGLPPLLERMVQVPDVIKIEVSDADSVLASAGESVDSMDPRPIRVSGPMTFGDRAKARAQIWLSPVAADEAVSKIRNTIFLAALAMLGAALFVLHRERKERNRVARRIAERDEERRLAEMGALAGLVTHEISNPMNSIRLGLEMLSELPVGADPAPVLKTMRTESERVGRTLENYMRLARPRATQAEAVTPDVLLDAAERVRVQAEAKGVDLQVEIAPGSAAASSHRLTLEQALANLLRNAVEASPKRTPVGARWSSDAEHVTIEINDAGPGFPADAPALVALGGASSTGHGLGIPLSKRFIEAHGGRLYLENGEHGARVRVVLRVVQSADGA